MARSKFRHVAIRGVCTVVPRKRIRIDDEKAFYPDASRLERLKRTVGLDERAVVTPETTPADLMACAARHLIADMALDVRGVDALICVLDFPDYRCPPTACVLHGELDMPETCMAFDINHGCAGYVYGLHIAHSMIEAGGVRRVLLLVGDTKSRTIDVRDRVSAPIFGDGAAATLLERDENSESAAFSLGAIGKLHSNIIVPAGGARMPASERTRLPQTDEFGNVRSLEDFRMDGRAVFDFTVREVPMNISDVIAYDGRDISELDCLVFHQANRSILQNIAVRVGVRDLSKVPTATLSKFGNLAVASIPSVLNDQLSARLQSGKMRMLLSGFGVGLAFGSAILATDSIYAPPPIVYEGDAE